MHRHVAYRHRIQLFPFILSLLLLLSLLWHSLLLVVDTSCYYHHHHRTRTTSIRHSSISQLVFVDAFMNPYQRKRTTNRQILPSILHPQRQSNTIIGITKQISTNLFAIKVTMKMVGKIPNSKNDHIEQLCVMYTKRCLTNGIDINTIWHKDTDTLLKSINDNNNERHHTIILDVKYGKQYTSEEFTKQLYNWYEISNSRLNIIIGDAYGLPNELLPNNPNTISSTLFHYVSLSTMTLTHQLAQLICMEQLYRSSEINKNSQYHK